MEIINLLKNPLDLKENKLFLIQNELEKYPYFQPLYLLQAKALINGDKNTFNSSLEKASAYCSNRQILFDYIFYKQKESSALTPKEDKTKVDLPPIPLIKSTSTKEENIAEEKTQLKTTKEAHSFSQWLKSGKASKKRSENDSHTQEHDKYHDFSNEVILKSNSEKESIEEKFKIINEFLEKSPKIVPSKDYKAPSVTLQSGEGMSHLMTETLAKIYVEQKKYDKAITAYNILRLKYPEKSGFFADQINFIKELKNN